LTLVNKEKSRRYTGLRCRLALHLCVALYPKASSALLHPYLLRKHLAKVSTQRSNAEHGQMGTCLEDARQFPPQKFKAKHGKQAVSRKISEKKKGKRKRK